MPSNQLILCYPLLLPPSIFPSITVFLNESVLCIRWPKYWSFSISISPSNEHLGLISFRMDWLALLAVQGTLKSLLQHHSSKASILQHSTFLQSDSHPYMTTGKTIALTRRTYVLNYKCLNRGKLVRQRRNKWGITSIYQQPVLKCSQDIYNSPNWKFFKCPKQRNRQWDSHSVENQTADVVKLQTMNKYIPLPVFVNTFFTLSFIY